MSGWAGMGDGRRHSFGGSQEPHGDAGDNSLLPCSPAWRFTHCLPSTCEAGGEESLYPPLQSKTNMLKSMVPSEAVQSFLGAVDIQSPTTGVTAPTWCAGPLLRQGCLPRLSVTPSTAVFCSLLM